MNPENKVFGFLQNITSFLKFSRTPDPLHVERIAFLTIEPRTLFSNIGFVILTNISRALATPFPGINSALRCLKKGGHRR